VVERLKVGDGALVEELTKEGYALKKERGVPQGSPTSCSLSVLNLRELFGRLRGLQMYADDGIFFPEGGDLEEISVPAAGVQLAPEKSQ
jgi:hypothetical protein